MEEEQQARDEEIKAVKTFSLKINILKHVFRQLRTLPRKN